MARGRIELEASREGEPSEAVVLTLRPDGEGQNRTADTTIFSRVLYQLSYLARAAKASDNFWAQPGPRTYPDRGFGIGFS